MLHVWCDERRRFGRRFPVQPPPSPRLGGMMPVLMRLVQTYLYCAAPPLLRLGSVLPVFGLFYCGLCGR